MITRSLVVLAAVSTWACADPPKRAASAEMPADSRTHDAAPRPPLDAAVGDFTNVTGPVDGLWPGMTVEAARAFLDAAGIAFEESSPNAKRPHYIVTALDDWQATLYFDEGYDLIAHILLQSPTVAVEADALVIIERVAASYGPAAEQSDEVRAWRNDRVTLEIKLHTSHARDGSTTWTVFMNWSRP